VRLFGARDLDYQRVLTAADELRQAVSGEVVRYVVNRNINYTNICYYRCKFCAFSKGKTHDALRGTPYDLALEEIVRRAEEAWERGATEVCLQGGIHPDYTGETYLGICRAIKQAVPEMHVHAFSPLEVTQGAATLGRSLSSFLAELKAAGLGTLPGTAAEILDDEVRAVICPDKVNTAQWVDVLRAAHKLGLRTTSTIMYGHVERPISWARHLLVLRDLQQETGGITEFVPLPFVHMEAPMYLRGMARKGPDAARGGVDARGGAAGAASADHQHPDIMGEDGTGGCGAVFERRSERSRRDPDEREHLARGGHAARAGVSARGDGGADRLDRTRAAAAHDGIWAGRQ